jgi:hypothetical protein
MIALGQMISQSGFSTVLPLLERLRRVMALRRGPPDRAEPPEAARRYGQQDDAAPDRQRRLHVI